jgi:hypothetical protein
MAKVIEFYIPKYFRKPHQWAPPLPLGKVILFSSQTKKSAFEWLKLALASGKGNSEALHGVDLDHARL